MSHGTLSKSDVQMQIHEKCNKNKTVKKWCVHKHAQTHTVLNGMERERERVSLLSKPGFIS